MCYLIAKKFDEPGCIAVEAKRGKELASLVSELSLKTLDRGVRILTVSDCETYGEYKPYHMVSSSQEFVAKALAM